MEILRKTLNEDIQQLHGKYDLSESTLDNLYSVYPFNRFEFVISHLIAEDVLSLEQYLELRNNYLRRNKYLYIFEITAPRTFGETWAQRHLNELVPELDIPSSKYDEAYSGQYDFWYDGIRIEVKASRAVSRKSGGTLLEKALSISSERGFNMNFQQIKPSCADVFVWVAVWRDAIRYWVLSSYEVEHDPYYSTGQHRGSVGEGQLWVTDKNIRDFDRYLVEPCNLLTAIKRKSQDTRKY